MLKFIASTASDRKLRLFAVACARRVAHLAGGDFGRRLEVAERFADGAGSLEELAGSWAAGLNSRVLGAAPVAWEAADYAAAAAGDACLREAFRATFGAMDDGQAAADPKAKTDPSGELPAGTEHAPQVRLLRDIFGNPFRPVDFAPEWRTEHVVAMTQRMYEARDFRRCRT
jgi:hypothetical protein